MRLRLAKVDEVQFLISIKKGVWGSKKTRFDDWKIGDLLVYIVDKSFAGIAKVDGVPYLSNRQIWDTGLFPFRIPVKFIHASFPSQRAPLSMNIRDILTTNWGPGYHRGILNQLLLEGNSAEMIAEAVKSAPNDIDEIKSNIQSLLDRAKLQQEKHETLYRKFQRIKKSMTWEIPFCDISGNEKELTMHVRAQYQLMELGEKIGYSVWISERYRNIQYKGKPFNETCLKMLPKLYINDDIKNGIASLDVVWFKYNMPICAFEVETTEKICGGLIRLSDLLTLMPVMNTKFYLVAPSGKEDSLINIVSRPTFEKTGISEYCKFLPIERLEELLSKINGLEGYVQDNILDTIAIDLQEELTGNLD